MIRGEDGELHEASWPEAIAFAATGLKGKRAGVLVGGRATVEDAYGYSV
jgi:NADH-quinone oxidoreductase subunit G